MLIITYFFPFCQIFAHKLGLSEKNKKIVKKYLPKKILHVIMMLQREKYGKVIILYEFDGQNVNIVYF